MSRNTIKLPLGLAGLLAALVIAAPGAHAGDGTGTLMVTAHGFKSTEGQVIVAVYKDGANWLELKNAYKLETVPGSKIKNGSVRVKFRDLPHGEYGVTVLHDKNQNDKMDMRWVPYPKPKEYAGVSNNWVRSGKPEYDKARFQFDRRIMSLRIKLRR